MTGLAQAIGEGQWELAALCLVLSGLALGRGANYVHALYTRLARLRENGQHLVDNTRALG
jgi:hypothetical protein